MRPHVLQALLLPPESGRLGRLTYHTVCLLAFNRLLAPAPARVSLVLRTCTQPVHAHYTAVVHTITRPLRTSHHHTSLCASARSHHRFKFHHLHTLAHEHATVHHKTQDPSTPTRRAAQSHRHLYPILLALAFWCRHRHPHTLHTTSSRHRRNVHSRSHAAAVPRGAYKGCAAVERHLLRIDPRQDQRLYSFTACPEITRALPEISCSRSQPPAERNSPDRLLRRNIQNTLRHCDTYNRSQHHTCQGEDAVGDRGFDR